MSIAQKIIALDAEHAKNVELKLDSSRIKLDEIKRLRNCLEKLKTKSNKSKKAIK